jgi:hypothetical protein
MMGGNRNKNVTRRHHADQFVEFNTTTLLPGRRIQAEIIDR